MPRGLSCAALGACLLGMNAASGSSPRPHSWMLVLRVKKRQRSWDRRREDSRRDARRRTHSNRCVRSGSTRGLRLRRSRRSVATAAGNLPWIHAASRDQGRLAATRPSPASAAGTTHTAASRRPPLGIEIRNLIARAASRIPPASHVWRPRPCRSLPTKVARQDGTRVAHEADPARLFSSTMRSTEHTSHIS
jgi:hypothetical protein